MTRSTEFGATVTRGVRAVQPDLVVHALRSCHDSSDGPRIGLVVSKSVGSAVQRHRVARRLRHVARTVIDVSLEVPAIAPVIVDHVLAKRRVPLALLLKPYPAP